MKKTVSMLLVVLLVFGFACANAELDRIDMTGALAAEDSVLIIKGQVEAWSKETGSTVEDSGFGTGLYLGDGYVLTVDHIISASDFVTVEDRDGNSYKSEKLLEDTTTDICVIKLDKEPENVVPVTFGDSDAVTKAQPILAIANYKEWTGEKSCGTVTDGIITDIDCGYGTAANFSRTMHLLRTNATIYDGGSGGALVNAEGEVIGMTVLLCDATGNEYASFLNYAIPASMLKTITSDLIEFGTVKRVRMGVMASTFDGPEEALKNYPPCGVLVSEVDEDGPAKDSGLLKNDIITHIDGERVRSFADMSAILDEKQPGDKIMLTVYRCADADGNYLEHPSTVEIEITLGIME